MKKEKFSYKNFFRNIILDFINREDFEIENDIYGNIAEWWFDQEGKTKEDLVESIKNDNIRTKELLDFITEIIYNSKQKKKYFIDFDDRINKYQFILSFDNILVGIKINFENFTYTYFKVKKVAHTCYKYEKE